MSDRGVDEHIEAARRVVREQAWAAPRVEDAWQRLARRQAHDHALRRRVTTVGGSALALAAALALVVAGWRALRSGAEPAAPAVAASAPRVERLALGEGSEARFEAGTQVEVRERNDSRVVVSLQAGAAHFRVRHDPRRLFRVLSGDIVVEDLGTTFEVENRGGFVRVSVSEGSVAVSFPGAGQAGRVSATLGAGETGTYPATATPPGAASTAPGQPAAPRATADGPASTGWRELARGGNHGRAYALLSPGGFRDVRDEPGDLLLAADAARLSHHPAEAASLLQKLLGNHPRDPRAPSAAFTRGWLLMKELGRPREAAAAFARAEALAPGGNLAEDALARTVEAWQAAGDGSRAQAEVDRYRRKYPRGRHLTMLDRLVRAR